MALENRQPPTPGSPPLPSGDTPGCGYSRGPETQGHRRSPVALSGVIAVLSEARGGVQALAAPGPACRALHPVCAASTLGGIGPHRKGDQGRSVLNLATDSWGSGRGPPPASVHASLQMTKTPYEGHFKLPCFWWRVWLSCRHRSWGLGRCPRMRSTGKGGGQGAARVERRADGASPCAQ